MSKFWCSFRTLIGALIIFCIGAAVSNAFCNKCAPTHEPSPFMIRKSDEVKDITEPVKGSE